MLFNLVLYEFVCESVNVGFSKKYSITGMQKSFQI